MLNARGTVEVAGFASLISQAVAGDGSTGGNAFGGFASVHTLPNANLHIASGADLEVNAWAGDASGQGAGGNATGGAAIAQADGGSTLTIDGFLDLLGSANGGSGSTDGSASPATMQILADGGTINLTGVATGSGGFDAEAVVLGSASDGNTEILARNGGTINLGDAILGAANGNGTVTLNAGDANSAGTINATSLLVSGDQASVTAQHGGEINVETTLEADATDGVTLSDDEGTGTISADTLHLVTSAITNQSSPDINNLFVHATGDLVYGDISVPGFIQISADGNLFLGDLDAGGELTLFAGGNLTVNDATSPDAAFTAIGTANFLGTVSAPLITVTSGDINIAQGASLGVTGITNLLTFNAVSTTPIYIGENLSAPAGSYVFNEDGDTHSANIVVNAWTPTELGLDTITTQSVTAEPDIVLGDLHIEGSQTSGGGVGHVTFNTDSSIKVLGGVDFVNAAASDSLTLNAGQKIQVITPDGGIRMIGSDGNLSGNLMLKAGDILATDATLADRLAADPNFSGRDQALATNNGSVNPAGYLQAGGIQLLAGSNIFIQNTGTATDFAGLTVGGGGLLVGRYQAITTQSGTQGFSFAGTLTTANDVLHFDFTVTSNSQVTLRTYSYAGGVNSAGQTIAAGGFDPILALFNAAGALINQNDDGGSNVPADPTTGAHFDTFLQTLLPAGSYTVTVMAYSNFAIGPNLSNGFRNSGNFSGRSPNFAFDVLGANAVTGPGATGALTMVGYGRRQNADGSFTTGSDFFNTVDFGLGSGVSLR